MSMKSEIQTTEKSKEDFANWNVAVDLHANGKYSSAIETYRSMHETSARMSYNMAVAYINLRDFRNAIKWFTSAVEKDENLAVAFFQRGTLHLEHKNVQDAIDDLEYTRMLLRGNTYINYKPLGLFCHLHGFTILYNLALAYLLNGDDREFRTLLTEATHYADYFQREQISDTFKLYEEFRWPEIKPIRLTTEAVFAPPKEVTKNLDRQQSSKSRRSMVVFASNENDNTPSFHGSKRVDELRRNLSQKRAADSRSGSMKQKLLRKMKSAGDLNIPAHMANALSPPRRQRHSTGSLRLDSDVPYKSFKGRKRSKKFSRKNKGVKSGNFNNDMTDSGEEVEREDLSDNDTPEADPFRTKNGSSECVNTANSNPSSVYPQSGAKHLLTETNIDNALKFIDAGKKHRFNGKARSLGDMKRTKHKAPFKTHERRSTGDLEKARSNSLLPLERKKKSHSSLLTLMKPKTNKQIADHPTVVMEGCKAVGDLLTLLVPIDSSINHNADVSEKETDFGKIDVNNNENGSVKLGSGSRYSLGSVFGDRSTVVKYALTGACDILTAAVTPTIDVSEACKQMNKTKQKDGALIRSNEQVQHKTKPSTKKRRAPDPPKPSIGLPLLAAGNLLTALVHQDHDQLAEDGIRLTEITEGVTQSGDGSTDVKGVNTIGDTREQPNVTASCSYELSKELNAMESNSSDHLETAFIFPPISKEPNTQDMNNNYVASKYELTPYLEPETPVYVNAKTVAEVSQRDEEKGGSELGMKLDNTEDFSELISSDKCTQQGNDLVPLKKSKLYKSKRTKIPPPPYPPPPLRIDSRKQRKSMKGKTGELTLNGLIGHSLLASGKMLGAIVSTAETSDGNKLCAANVSTNKAADDILNNDRVGELSYLMEARCGIGQGKTEEEEHAYVNVNETLEEYRSHVNTCLSNDSSRRQAQQEPEGRGGMLRTSSNILRAFVTSSQDTREAFEDFIYRQRNNRTKYGMGGHLLNEDFSSDSENDYVNMTDLRK